MNVAIIFAGGIGQRLNNNSQTLPKQFLEIEGKPILIHTLEHFEKHPEIDRIYISTLPQYIAFVKDLTKKWNITKTIDVVEGGSCAMESIYKTLLRAKKDCSDETIVLIHDGVRPVITPKVISSNIKLTKEKGNAITTIPCNETVIISEDNISAKYVPTRKETFKAQAPQSFKLGEIIKAHQEIKSYENIVDNCTLFMSQSKKVNLIKGNFGNIKITTIEDVYLLKGILEYIKTKDNQ